MQRWEHDKQRMLHLMLTSWHGETLDSRATIVFICQLCRSFLTTNHLALLITLYRPTHSVCLQFTEAQQVTSKALLLAESIATAAPGVMVVLYSPLSYLEGGLGCQPCSKAWKCLSVGLYHWKSRTQLSMTDGPLSSVSTSVLLCHGKSSRQQLDMEALLGASPTPIWVAWRKLVTLHFAAAITASLSLRLTWSIAQTSHKLQFSPQQCWTKLQYLELYTFA